ncbi:MAG: hypothetical protein SOX72_00970, partial [Oscillospiraceae bacterium]|nr:hypothetical protein [Oscillospiraceae bacterium]
VRPPGFFLFFAMRSYWCADGGAAGGGRRHSLVAPEPKRRGADAAGGGARKLCRGDKFPLQSTDERGTIKTEAEERKFSSGGVAEIPESIIGQLPDKAFEELYWKAQREELEGGEFQKELALLQQQYGGENAGEAENTDRDIIVGKSLGAKAKNYDIELPDKEIVHLTEKSRISMVQTIAGYGRDRQIDEIHVLVDKYGGDPEKWQKKKGVGYVDFHGESYKAEIHWYEEPSVGKVKFKAKAHNGEWIIDDE